MHRRIRILSTALITAGLVVLADAVATLLWQEPVSAAYASLQQIRAGDELADLESEFDPGDVGFLTANASEAARARVLAERFEEAITTGQPIGRVKIDSIGLDTVLMDGTDTATLQKGPGRYPRTPLPGFGSTTGIAGHRTTYLAPFRKINEISDGDEVRVELPYAVFTYEVEKHEIVDPSNVEIVDPVGYERIVLTACHPLYSAAERWAVFGRLIDIDTFAISGEGEWVAF
ncbi:MAG: sortase family protein [Solirubrobacterales bacterium]|nr:sortase family protein [Solirubrobacterales bacterium]